jgi:hypothetical protein
MPAQNEVRNWAIVSENGLTLLVNLTKAEAEDHVRENPLTPSGDSSQFAVPMKKAKELTAMWKREGVKAEMQLNRKRRSLAFEVLHPMIFPLCVSKKHTGTEDGSLWAIGTRKSGEFVALDHPMAEGWLDRETALQVGIELKRELGI